MSDPASASVIELGLSNTNLVTRAQESQPNQSAVDGRLSPKVGSANTHPRLSRDILQLSTKNAKLKEDLQVATLASECKVPLD